MKLILLDIDAAPRRNFDPVGLSRPLFELRCGITNLAEKLIAKTQPADVACFVPDYLADVYRAETAWCVNDPAVFARLSVEDMETALERACVPWP